jgi:hypothetical protein
VKTQPLLSTLWIVLMFNYLYCDLLGLHDPAYLAGVLAGELNGISFTPEFGLAAGVLMQVPIAMVLLSRLLARRVGRWVNIGAATFMALVQTATLFVGTASPSYLLYSIIEIGLLGAIIVVVARWKQPAAPAAV